MGNCRSGNNDLNFAEAGSATPYITMDRRYANIIYEKTLILSPIGKEYQMI
jgi:hypothetical protein